MKSSVGKQKGKGICGEARRKEEGRRKEMWLCDNVVIWSFQITSAFYIAVTKIVNIFFKVFHSSYTSLFENLFKEIFPLR